MKINLFKPGVISDPKKHIVRFQTGVGFFWILWTITIILILSLTANAVMLRMLTKDMASHVSYYCANPKKHSIITRSARIYPAIKDLSQIDNLERNLEQETSCPIVSIIGWRDVPCNDCGKDKELAKQDKIINDLSKELARGKGK